MASATGAQQTRALTSPPAHSIQQWTTADGLPQNSVNAIAYAPDGYLWVGTFGGLARFDGARFTLVERVDDAGRHVDRVLSLAVGLDSSLWIGTENGLFRRRGDAYQAFDTLAAPTAEPISALFVDRSGALWVGTASGVVARYADGVMRPVNLALDSPSGSIVSFREDDGGTIWINHGDSHLAVSPSGRRLASDVVRRAPGAIYMLLQDRAGDHWFSTPTGVRRVRGPAAHERRRDLVSSPSPGHMLQASGSGYWLATRNDGLVFSDPDGAEGAIHLYPLPDGRQRYRVRALVADPEGNVWVGTDANGLLRARRNVFTTYTSAHGLSFDVATAVFGDAAGRVWVGTNCGGVNVVDLARRTVSLYSPRLPGDPLGDPCIFALGETRSATAGTMWQGTYGGGVTRIHGPLSGRSHRLAGIPDSVIRSLFTDRAGTLWVGTDTRGLVSVIDGAVRARYTTADGLAHNSVRTIHQSRDGTLWIGTLDGLSRLRDGKVTSIAAGGQAATHIRAIHEDERGALWLGTYGGGLVRFRDGSFKTITRQQGLAEDVVSAILVDARGNFWMSGNRGIQRVARSELDAVANGTAPRVHAVLYGASDGMVSAETNGGFQPAALKDARGRFWFPTVQGVTMVDPAEITLNARAPRVRVEEVAVNGAVRAPGDGLELGPGPTNLEFSYAGISLAAPEHLTFRYRLEGFDTDWVNAGTRRVAYYPRLTPGSYRFIVASANRDGVWSEAGAGLALRIVPRFWNAWWFRLAAALALTLALIVAYRRREAIARRERAAQDEFSRRLIESQEQERRRIARELHDGLGQELLAVRNRALLALRSADLDAQTRDQLRQIGDVSAQSLENVRRLARNLTPHQLDHLGLTVALRTMIDDVAESAEIDLDATVDDIDGRLPAETGLGVYRIVQEALSNVVRHAHASTASVRVRARGDAVFVTVEDAGRGFRMPDDGLPGVKEGLGLAGITERVRILGGVATITSAPGRGTRIQVSLPAIP